MIADEDRVTILELGPFDGHGITRARWEGRAVEVEHGIPGEEVRAEILGKNRLYGRILEVITPDPDRVEPPCPYFTQWSCGGCQWQQIRYPGQLRRKRAAVDAELQRVGLNLDVSAMRSLDDPWRYRTTAGIALGKRAGFRRHASLAIVPIRDCPISHPLIGRLLLYLNDRLDTGSLPDFRGRVRLETRLDETDPEGLQVLIQPDPSHPLAPPDLDALTAVLSAMPEVNGILLSGVEQPNILKGTGWGEVRLLDRPVTLSPASFFQTNLRLLPELIERIRREVGPAAGKRIVDVYGGIGIFGLSLAAEGARVTIVEPDFVAIEAAKRTASAWGLVTVEFRTQTAEDGLDDLGEQDVAILDPPRTGLSDAVRDAVAYDGPPLLLYISCLAASLARDLPALLAAGYKLHALELFDFYPQTYHLELLAVLRRGGK